MGDIHVRWGAVPVNTTRVPEQTATDRLPHEQTALRFQTHVSTIEYCTVYCSRLYCTRKTVNILLLFSYSYIIINRLLMTAGIGRWNFHILRAFLYLIVHFGTYFWFVWCYFCLFLLLTAALPFSGVRCAVKKFVVIVTYCNYFTTHQHAMQRCLTIDCLILIHTVLFIKIVAITTSIHT